MSTAVSEIGLFPPITYMTDMHNFRMLLHSHPCIEAKSPLLDLIDTACVLRKSFVCGLIIYMIIHFVIKDLTTL